MRPEPQSNHTKLNLCGGGVGTVKSLTGPSKEKLSRHRIGAGRYLTRDTKPGRRGRSGSNSG